MRLQFDCLPHRVTFEAVTSTSQMNADAMSGLMSAQRLHTVSIVPLLASVSQRPHEATIELPACPYLLPARKRQYHRPKRNLWGKTLLMYKDHSVTMSANKQADNRILQLNDSGLEQCRTTHESVASAGLATSTVVTRFYGSARAVDALRCRMYRLDVD